MPTTLPSYRIAARACAVLAGFAALALGANAQSAATGTISGRVLDASSGRYLTQVRITVEGTTLETFTDNFGDYRLDNVPAGAAKLDATYTGRPTQNLQVTVAAGQTTSENISFGATGANGGIVQLDQFVVTSQKETNAKEIAINEQRFAPSIEKAVSADQFGQIFQDNIAEFVKFIPGVSIDYNSMDARWIMVRGLSPQYTPVYTDGMRMASAASVSESRYFETEEVSMNNVARVVESESRTPDIPADALGGSIDMISKSAFEYSKEELDYEVFDNWNGNHKNLGATPGPGDNSFTHKHEGNVDLTFVDPVTPNFGFTLSLLDENLQNEQYRSNPQWNPNGRNTAPTAAGSATGATEANPFLEDYVLQDAPKNSIRHSAGATTDWKITPDDTLSFAMQENYYDSYTHARNVTFDTSTTAPLSFGPTFTNGAIGKGAITMGSSDRNKWGTTFNFNTRYSHHGPVWTVNAKFEYSHAATHYADAADGYFDSTVLTLKSMSVNYANIDTYNGVRPGAISVFNATGGGINPYNYQNYNIVSALSDPENGQDIFHVWQADIARDIGTNVVTTIKLGAALSWEDRSDRILDNSYNYVGPASATAGTSTGIGSAGLYNLTDAAYSRVAPPYGFAPFTWMSNAALFQLEQNNPSLFQLIQTGSTGSVAEQARNSSFISEKVPAIYFEGDTKLMDNRLRLVYGVRGEETEDDGFGAKVDPNAIFAGDLATGALLTTDPVAQEALIYQDRALENKVHYGTFYPSANLTFNFTGQLLFRAAYYRGLGRPNYNNIVGVYTLPADTSPGQLITAPNPQLAPEQDNNYDFDLEYYNKVGGVASVGVFRKDFTNFFGTITQPLTSQLAAQNGISQGYVNEGDFLSTPENAGSARIQGVEINLSQPIKCDGLPSWANGFSVFANTTVLHMTGGSYSTLPSVLPDFTNFINKETNFGMNYSAGRVVVDLDWNARGQEKMTVASGDPSGASYTYFKARMYLDLDASYQIAPHVSIYVSGTNVTNVPQDEQEYGPLNPGYSHLVRREIFGPTYAIGLRGKF
jgi:iron complex outermembrane receptor protein